MRWHATTTRRVVTFVALGVLAGSSAGIATTSLVARATAGAVGGAGAVFDVTHSPPLLTVPGERSDELVFETHCLPEGVDDPEAGCNVEGTLFAREAGDAPYVAIPLASHGPNGARLTAPIPDVLSRAGAFEYYAVFESADLEAPVTTPPGGDAAPFVSRRLTAVSGVALGRHAFGAARRSGDRVVFAQWGEGPREAGLETGWSAEPVGASAFDVDASGSVFVLDHAHRRVLRWASGARAPVPISVSISGAMADLATSSDGSFYVLETTSHSGRMPMVKRFDDGGRELEAVESAERGPAQIRIGPDGPVVLQRPSHQWMPVSVAGVPASQAAQRRRGRMGRLLRSGAEVVVLRVANELRVALLASNRIVRAWRITSDTPLGEVQLAEPVGGQFVVVVRVYADRSDEFAVLMLDRRGLVSLTTLAAADWAEAAPLGRFRLVGRTLYRLGSSPTGVFVDRFDLEVRP
jgi:hypothetical protein